MKPQSKAKVLDDADGSPHPWIMVANDDRRKPPADSREAKLAQALRANLRRRKVGGQPPSGKPAQEEDGKS